MEGFKRFLKEDGDVKKSLDKLPKKFRELVKGFKIEFEPNNTLKGDDGHVGVIMTHPQKIIRVASPWNYGREFAFLHEVGHLVWEKFVRGTKWETEWKDIHKDNKNRKKNEPDEENWCHAFSNRFVQHKLITNTHPEWDKYFDRFVKAHEKA